MKKILILGAGRSSGHLIEYLITQAHKYHWKLRVGDYSIDLAHEKIKDANNAKAFHFDAQNEGQCIREISDCDLVISMLPANMHISIAQFCIELGKNMVTASYVSDAFKSLDAPAKEKGLTILKECGLDPGIDHMSAMFVMDQIRKKGGDLTSFETFTGGLLAPTTDDNPWQYKFTWNPRNVVLAGNGTVKFIQEGRFKYIPYHRLFKRTEVIHIPEYGYFEGYANRDSLKYLEIYGLEGIRTLYRGTLRRPGFCKTWNIFVQLGATDDSYEMEGVHKMTHRQFINSFLSYNPYDSVELKLAHYMNLDRDAQEMYMLKWLGMFENEPIGLKKGTPAQILEHILKKKWTLNPDDRDMIVMWHKFEYTMNGENYVTTSHMVAEGENATNTAMAKTVGLPLGIAAKNILLGKIDAPGLIVPNVPEVYLPVLKELKKYGIRFYEEGKKITNAGSMV
ncbi:MAG TPA: saccharopine dehydrogenase [Cytophagales bacterium]|jgi:saccharopine dehydrogenase-like NADP-dependent oxidoreductase|nr:saccharopine dehydrogenase [Cytophagales bacterium]